MILFLITLQYLIICFISYIPVKIIKIPIKSFFGYVGITMQPFIFHTTLIDPENDIRFMKHEMEHIHQQRLFTPPLFYVLYILEFIKNLIIKRKWFDQYLSLSFEIDQRIQEFDGKRLYQIHFFEQVGRWILLFFQNKKPDYWKE